MNDQGTNKSNEILCRRWNHDSASSLLNFRKTKLQSMGLGRYLGDLATVTAMETMAANCTSVAFLLLVTGIRTLKILMDQQIVPSVGNSSSI